MKMQKYVTLGLIVLFSPMFTQQSHAEAVPEPTAESAASPTEESALSDSGEPETPSKEKKKKKKEKVKVSGVLQTHFLHRFDSNDDGEVRANRFRVQRAQITFRGKVNRYVSYDVMIDPRSPEITGVLRDAFFDVKKLIPRHRLRIGQHKTEFGYENGRSSSRLYTVNRSEVSDNLARGEATLRDIGVSILGGWPIAEGFRLEDAISLVNGSGMNMPDDTKRKNLWGRVGVRYKGMGAVARLGVSAADGDVNDEGDPLDPADDFIFTFNRLGADVQINHDHFRLNAEYVKGENDVDGEVEELSGYYVTLVGKTPWRVGPVVRYDTTDEDGDIFRRWTLGAYYGRPRDEFRVLVNYERQEEEVELDDGSLEVTRGDDRLYVWTQVRF
ncbi:MAG: porin [Candidatus Poribacteria bacterium]|nr:porin [Candidatus Poribacteria bacterium]